MSNLIHFHWYRGEDTEWVETTAVGQRNRQWWLVPDPRSAVCQYQPLKEQLALFRTFGDTEPTLEGIAEFAAAYGVLGAGREQLMTENISQIGEPAYLWEREIAEMKFAVETWDAKEDEENLAERIGLESNGESLRSVRLLIETYPGGSPFLSEVISERHHPEIWPHIKSSSHGTIRRQAALFYVLGAINYRMEKYSAPRVLYNPNSGDVELHIDPGNLLGAMWLQFARAIEAEKDYRRCRICRTWFEVSADGKRRQTKYCSTRCRVRAYRDRQGEALRRNEAGESHSKIARDLGTTVKSVRGWVQAAEGASQPPGRKGKKGS